MNRRGFLLSASAIVGGCASGVWHLPSYDDLPKEKTGLAIASIGGRWPVNARFSVIFRPIESPKTIGEFYFLRNSIFANIPVDIAQDSIYGTVTARKLLPGKYEIYYAEVMVGSSMVQMYYGDKRPFSFPFEVHAGKATYLGEFLGYPAVAGSGAGGAVFTVRDQQTRDLDILRKRGIEVPPSSVISAVMTKSQSANSVFRRLDDAL